MSVSNGQLQKILKSRENVEHPKYQSHPNLDYDKLYQLRSKNSSPTEFKEKKRLRRTLKTERDLKRVQVFKWSRLNYSV